LLRHDRKKLCYTYYSKEVRFKFFFILSIDIPSRELKSPYPALFTNTSILLFSVTIPLIEIHFWLKGAALELGPTSKKAS
jgi:hypothetical protein